MNLQNKKIVLGVSGGVAAYKAVALTSKLVQAGADVRVMMTPNATEFVQPLMFRTISNNPVTVEQFDNPTEWNVNHISYAEFADLMIIAPCTANVIAKVAHGIADDFLTTTVLATKCPVWIFPAMNENMLENRVTQDNISKLKDYGIKVFGTGDGHLACGTSGKGRMLEPETIFDEVEKFFTCSDCLKGKKVLITSGPTVEEIDPVRYISNYSSGKMGFSFAEAFNDFGADVTVVTGPCNLSLSSDIERIDVKSARDMYSKCCELYQLHDYDYVVFMAAVADYSVKNFTDTKIKKMESMSLELIKNPDIAFELGRVKKCVHIGACAETDNVEINALEKVRAKNFDYIMSNDVTKEGAGFNVDTNIVTLYASNGKKYSLPKMSKSDVAKEIVKYICDINN